jgi:CRP/FNR family transcriptional regulator, cyclic AMP receptor protein
MGLGWAMNHIELVGFLGAGLMVVTLAMRTMIPLRMVGIASNVVQIAFALLAGITPMLVQHVILLPMNGYRLLEQLRLVRKLRTASDGDLSMDWLIPYMSKRRVRAGEILFHKGDAADEMFIVATGRLRLNEIAVDVLPGAVVGELGLLAPNNRRTQTLACVEDAEVMQIAYQRIQELYFENPSFGFYFLRLTSARLFENIAKLEASLGARDQEIQRLRAQIAAVAVPRASA